MPKSISTMGSARSLCGRTICDRVCEGHEDDGKEGGHSLGDVRPVDLGSISLFATCVCQCKAAIYGTYAITQRQHTGKMPAQLHLLS